MAIWGFGQDVNGQAGKKLGVCVKEQINQAKNTEKQEKLREMTQKNGEKP